MLTATTYCRALEHASALEHVYLGIILFLYTVQLSLERQYISARLNIRTLLEKQDRKLFSKIFKLSIHPLHKQVPKAKAIDHNLGYKNSARTLINTKRFKDAFINRLTYKYDLRM